MSTTVRPAEAVRTIEHAWIPMRDGTKLAARIWLPGEAAAPTILEYIPYRKRDMTRGRDAGMHPYFASCGYASIRVDLRGSGDSEGILADEYLPQELDDGEDVIAWIASQPWSDGQVGMIGISWGGFNGLQIAARRPEALKAVVSVCSTDDRYADDVHYMGGCLLGDNASWASTMFAYNSMPPDPQLVGDAWRDMWLERLEGSGLWLKAWLEHQHRDEYWKHGSVCENYGDIEVPVMAVSGWADGYSNAVFRLLAGLKSPCLGIVGPWSHTYPHLGTPGPAIGFLQECVRFWDYWMRGKDTGVMDEPALRAWMLESVNPATDYRMRPGRWVSEEQWPSGNVICTRRRLVRGRLLPPDDSGDSEHAGSGRDSSWDDAPEPAAERLSIQSPLSVGLFAGKWCSYASAPDLPYDQREEDGGSLVFDSEELSEACEILGAPTVELELSSNEPVAMVAVRLSDVAPSGKATRVTYGLLNLTHRKSHEHPEPLEPGKPEKVVVELNYIAQRFSPGHRIRLSISTSYWPLAWPSPRPVRLELNTAGCAVNLPVRHSTDERDPADGWFEPAERTPAPEKTVIKPAEHNWFVVRDLAREQSELQVIGDQGRYRIESIDLEVERRTDEWFRYRGDDVSSAEAEMFCVRALKRGSWSVRTETRTVLRCTEETFELHASLDGYEGDIRAYSRSWIETIPRKLV
ncbi:MAG: CocE/NonD family hydrolase [Spirochaetales bacterium]